MPFDCRRLIRQLICTFTKCSGERGLSHHNSLHNESCLYQRGSLTRRWHLLNCCHFWFSLRRQGAINNSDWHHIVLALIPSTKGATGRYGRGLDVRWLLKNSNIGFSQSCREFLHLNKSKDNLIYQLVTSSVTLLTDRSGLFGRQRWEDDLSKNPNSNKKVFTFRHGIACLTTRERERWECVCVVLWRHFSS